GRSAGTAGARGPARRSVRRDWTWRRLLHDNSATTLTSTRTRQRTRSCCLAHKKPHLTAGSPDNAASHETRTRVTLASQPAFTLRPVAEHVPVRAAPATTIDEGTERPCPRARLPC